MITSSSLGSSIVDSSLTSVGTLTGLNVNGDIDFTGKLYNNGNEIGHTGAQGYQGATGTQGEKR